MRKALRRKDEPNSACGSSCACRAPFCYVFATRTAQRIPYILGFGARGNIGRCRRMKSPPEIGRIRCQRFTDPPRARRRDGLAEVHPIAREHLDHINQSYTRFFNELRPHQGLGNRTLPAAAAGPPEELVTDTALELGRIRCRRFLGGLLRHYYRAAA